MTDVVAVVDVGDALIVVDADDEDGSWIVGNCGTSCVSGGCCLITFWHRGGASSGVIGGVFVSSDA